MRFSFICSTLILSFVFGASLSAQRPGGEERNRPTIASVQGTVVEMDGVTPVSFASVALVAMRDSSVVAGQLANQDGSFALAELPIGRYRLKIQFMGYESFDSDLIVLTPRTSVHYDAGDILLAKKVNSLDEAVVATEVSTL